MRLGEEVESEIEKEEKALIVRLVSIGETHAGRRYASSIL